MKYVFLISVSFLFIRCGTVVDNIDKRFKVDNKSSDTLMYWFNVLSNKQLYNTAKNTILDGKVILPSRITFKEAPDWNYAIESLNGQYLYLLDYRTFQKYKNGNLKLDSNVVTNCVRYKLRLSKNVMDSCNWTITYDGK